MSGSVMFSPTTFIFVRTPEFAEVIRRTYEALPLEGDQAKAFGERIVRNPYSEAPSVDLSEVGPKQFNFFYRLSREQYLVALTERAEDAVRVRADRLLQIWRGFLGDLESDARFRSRPMSKSFEYTGEPLLPED